jgi:hypothetical protein
MSYINRILIIGLVLFVFSTSIFYLLDKGLTKYSSNISKKFTEMFSDTSNYDVLLLGTSRTYQNIDVKICDSITGMKFYNLGIGGAGGFEIMTALKGFLESHSPPKKVVLNVDGNMLDIHRGFHNPTFYFHSLENSAIYSAFKEKGYPVWLYKNIPFTRMFEFNDDMRNNCLRGLFFLKDEGVECYHGYLPMLEKIGKFDTIYKKVSSLGNVSENFQYIDSIVNICKINKIHIIFITSPVYNHHFSKRNIDYDVIMEEIKEEIASKQGIPMLFFDDLPLNFSYKNFADNIHLNLYGTRLFSYILANKLRE